MDRVRRARRPLRATITKKLNEATLELDKEEVDHIILKVHQDNLEELIEQVKDYDKRILEAMQNAEPLITEEEMDAEHNTINDYKDKVKIMVLRIKATQPAVEVEVPEESVRESDFGGAASSHDVARTYKLPKIQIKKFNGELTEWLSFWSQFQKIDEDETLHNSDKFQYLVQSISSGTRARRVVESYPQSPDNYAKVVEALKSRFGDQTLLTEVYVRELLKLIVKNASEKKDVTLTDMYDELESHLRALESLGVTMDQNAVFLYPMVESSLPDDILEVWQRSPKSGYDNEEEEMSCGDRLKSLMKFLGREVKGAERLSFVKSGLSSSSQSKERSQRNSRNPRRPRNNNTDDDIPTIAGLHAGEKEKCVFCNKHTDSKDCSMAADLTLQKKNAIVKEKRLCFQCLRPGHRAEDCKTFLRCLLCKRKHVILMCPNLPAHQKPKDEKKKEENSRGSDFATKVSDNLACTSKVILGTLMVPVKTKNGTRMARVLFDNGSQRSYILKKLTKELDLSPVGKEEIIHCLFSGVETESQNHNKFHVQLKPLKGGFSQITVLDQETICGSIPRMANGPWMKELKEKKVWLSDIGSEAAEIEILIGANHYGRILTGRILQLQNGLTAVETVLGWTLTGPSLCADDSKSLAMLATSLQVSDATVEQLWSLESIGIQDSAEVLSKQDKEDAVKQHFLKTVTRLENGRYSVSLPWIDGAQKIPDNKSIAEKRLKCTTAKLKEAGLVCEYDKIFKLWVNEGFIEEVPLDSVSQFSHYLPHRAVIKPESLTTPIRPVFDASCKTARSPSLNECLEKGPNLMELIPSILLRFREKKIGIVSDVRKAFQMVEVNKCDRDFLRFLWWEDEQANKMKIYRHKRVVFGVNCSPFLLAAVIEYHLRGVTDDRQAIATQLLESLYVDNCVTSVDTMKEYEDFRKQSTTIMNEARMELRLWQCSSGEEVEVGSLTSRECGLTTGRAFAKEAECSITVLGLRWNFIEDYLTCDFDVEALTGPITKRKVLSSVQKIYDPIGFVCPVLLQPKMILQEVWALKIGWDQELPEEKKATFMIWHEEIKTLKEVKIPRNFTEGQGSRKCWQLHAFCDASKDAYAAVIFLRIEDEHGTSVQLLQAKSRVAPLKRTTIPRLELLSCTIGARLMESVRKSLNFENTPCYFWSDSTTALAWIKRNDHWGTFVGNRVREILRLSQSDWWNHVPGAENLADLPSRGCTASQLLKSRWWEGPSWLKESRGKWPTELSSVNEEEVISERKKSVIAAMIASESQTPWYEKYSSYYQNIRSIAWVMRFVKWTRGLGSRGQYLKLEEIASAEKILLKLIQQQFSKADDVISGIRVIRDEDGLIRVKTKLVYREDNKGFRYPILLPHCNRVVDLLIEEEHRRHGHAGIQYLMGKIRENYWILQGRKTIRRVVSKCVTCRRFTSKKPEVVPAPLPSDRVGTGRAFEVTGVDLAGPLLTKEKKKVWIVLFTCAVYRCVHLDLVDSLSTEAFLEAFQRFIDRRGRPSTVYSDNGTNFVGAVSAFKSINWDTVTKKCGLERIRWKFNPPTAAWWGGWWERLIRSVKDLLKKMLGKAKVSKQKLSNYIISIEAIINGRPLTTVTEDPEDLIPLTPAMFLTEIPAVSYSEMDFLNAHDFQSIYQERKNLLDEFKMRFRKEYLGLLVQRQKDKKVKAFEVGEVVLVGADGKKRWEWPLGRIIETLPGKDGCVRVARVKTAHGELLRPIQRLFPLEVSMPLNIPQVEEIPVERVLPKKLVTRSGRIIKAPQRFTN